MFPSKAGRRYSTHPCWDDYRDRMGFPSSVLDISRNQAMAQTGEPIYLELCFEEFGKIER